MSNRRCDTTCKFAALTSEEGFPVKRPVCYANKEEKTEHCCMEVCASCGQLRDLLPKGLCKNCNRILSEVS